MPSKSQISLRLPSELLDALDSLSEEKSVTRTELIISLLWYALSGGERSKRNVQNARKKSLEVHSQVSPSLQENQLQTSLAKLTKVIEASTAKQGELVGQLSQLIAKYDEADIAALAPMSVSPADSSANSSVGPTGKTRPKKKPSPKSTSGGSSQYNASAKAKRKTTKQGGKPAPLYVFEGKEATLREHVQRALPQLDKRQLDRARSNINRKIKGRSDRKSKNTQTPAEAIAHEIERIRADLGLED